MWHSYHQTTLTISIISDSTVLLSFSSFPFLSFPFLNLFLPISMESTSKRRRKQAKTSPFESEGDCFCCYHVRSRRAHGRLFSFFNFPFACCSCIFIYLLWFTLAEVNSTEWEFIDMTEPEEDLIHRMHRLIGDRCPYYFMQSYIRNIIYTNIHIHCIIWFYFSTLAWQNLSHDLSWAWSFYFPFCIPFIIETWNKKKEIQYFF